MADVVIYGWERSTYVWTVRLVCAEKGVSHALEPLDMKSKAHLDLHPFAKMPVLRHGDLVLYETSAICRYIDATFGGAALKPVKADERARMEQWISVLNAYCYDPLIRRFVLQYAFPKGADGQPDRAVIDAALEGRDFLAGDAPSIADFFLVPMLFYVRLMPEGARLLKSFGDLRRVHDGLMERPSFAATKPAFEK